MRPLICEIRLENLRHNYLFLKQIHGKKLLAVVKADAYGHGAVACAHALHDLADGCIPGRSHKIARKWYYKANPAT